MERHNIIIISVLLSFSFFQNSIANECSTNSYSCTSSAESSTKILVNNKTKVETSLNVLSLEKRSFGGVEPTNYVSAFTGVFGVPGWLTLGLEAFSDINFHLLGYTALGKLIVFVIISFCIKSSIRVYRVSLKNTRLIGSVVSPMKKQLIQVSYFYSIYVTDKFDFVR